MSAPLEQPGCYTTSGELLEDLTAGMADQITRRL